jgi:hypothetical protein
VVSPENSQAKMRIANLYGFDLSVNHKFLINSESRAKGSVKKILFAHPPIMTLPADHPIIPEMRSATLRLIFDEIKI